MPRIIIKCDCKKDLRVVDSHVNNQGDIIMVVDTCEKCLNKIPTGHGKCSECEDAKLLREISEKISSTSKTESKDETSN